MESIEEWSAVGFTSGAGIEFKSNHTGSLEKQDNNRSLDGKMLTSNWEDQLLKTIKSNGYNNYAEKILC